MKFQQSSFEYLQHAAGNGTLSFLASKQIRKSCAHVGNRLINRNIYLASEPKTYRSLGNRAIKASKNCEIKISRISEIKSLSLQPFICCQKHFQKATAQIEQIGLKVGPEIDRSFKVGVEARDPPTCKLTWYYSSYNQGDHTFPIKRSLSEQFPRAASPENVCISGCGEFRHDENKIPSWKKQYLILK
uniref:Uncharacterized protein n=1 Tax=Romanomermis culicivorax TaxID=13658 RepID=A0A915K9E4_ROMCU